MHESRLRRPGFGVAVAAILVLTCANTGQAASGAGAASAPTGASPLVAGHSLADLHPSTASASTFAETDLGSFMISSDWGNYSYCLESMGYNQQARLEGCGASAEGFWDIWQTSATDSRGGFWANLENKGDHYCLDAQANATGSPNNNGDHVNSWQCDEASQQSWYFWPLSGAAQGDWMIVNHYNTSMVLDSETDGTWNDTIAGDPVQLWTHNGSLEQTWIAN